VNARASNSVCSVVTREKKGQRERRSSRTAEETEGKKERAADLGRMRGEDGTGERRSVLRSAEPAAPQGGKGKERRGRTRHGGAWRERGVILGGGEK